jgi:hypothetical protein
MLASNFSSRRNDRLSAELGNPKLDQKYGVNNLVFLTHA